MGEDEEFPTRGRKTRKEKVAVEKRVSRGTVCNTDCPQESNASQSTGGKKQLNCICSAIS